MGMHPCSYCYPDIGVPLDQSRHIYNSSSSGDITLTLPNGDIFEMPDMILHYVFDHGWLPPEVFIVDILKFETDQILTFRMQTKGGIGLTGPVDMKIGYLSGEYPMGEVSQEFKNRLVRIIEVAAKDYPWMVSPKKQEKGE